MTTAPEREKTDASAQVDLENFEVGGPPTPLSSEYKRGLQAGLTQAAETQIAARVAALESASTALQDMTFGFTEARVHLINHMRPVLAQIAETLLPDVLRSTFGLRLAEALSAHFEAVLGDPVTIALPPSAVDELQAALSSSTQNFAFIAQPDLKDGQAIITQNAHNLMIDFSALLGALQTALNGLEASERTSSHG